MRNRKNIRKKDHDYRKPGIYFVTICTRDREHYFGEIDINRKTMRLSELWKHCDHEISRLSERANVKIHEYVIMPDHVHILLSITKTRKSPRFRRDVSIIRPAMENIRPAMENTCPSRKDGSINRPPAMVGSFPRDGLLNRPYEGPSLWSIMKLFKWNITKYAKQKNILFQRQWRFHDRIVRTSSGYQNIIQYIRNNQKNRKDDDFY